MAKSVTPETGNSETKVYIYFYAWFCFLILCFFLDKLTLIDDDFLLVSCEIQFVFNLANLKNMNKNIIVAKYIVK